MTGSWLIAELNQARIVGGVIVFGRIDLCHAMPRTHLLGVPIPMSRARNFAVQVRFGGVTDFALNLQTLLDVLSAGKMLLNKAADLLFVIITLVQELFYFREIGCLVAWGTATFPRLRLTVHITFGFVGGL